MLLRTFYYDKCRSDLVIPTYFFSAVLRNVLFYKAHFTFK